MSEASFEGHRPGSTSYRRITLGLFLAGLATFAMVYCPQPILPVLQQDFAVDPGTATLALSVTTTTLGVALLFLGPLSDAVGRLTPMRASLVAASLLAVASAVVPSWHAFLVLRALLGLALAGLPAVATAYLREEVHPSAATRAITLYIGGTAAGSMTGRLLTGVLADVFGWRIAVGAIGGLALALAVCLGLLLPAPRSFVPTPLHPAALTDNVRRMVLDRGLLTLYAVGFTTMGAFVACFNGLAFRLAAAPFGLSSGTASLLFLTYLLGTWASTRAGGLAVRHGSRAVVPAAVGVFAAGVALTVVDSLWTLVPAAALISVGFFATHSTTSAWVTTRASRKGRGTGLAGSLYLTFYYLGSSVCGALAGLAWGRLRWDGVLWLVGTLLAAALGLALSMRRVPVIPERGSDLPPGA